MSNDLSLDSSKWNTTIENRKEKCLTSEESAKNVKHVLSTATVRSHQRKLFAAVYPYIPTMLNSIAGTSILTSLVKYGTSRTVDGVAKEVAENYSKLLALTKVAESKLLISLAELLDALVYRVDCKGEHRSKILSILKLRDRRELFGTVLTILAAGRLFTIDGEFSKSIISDNDAKLALCKAARDNETKVAALRCCELILSKDATVDVAEGNTSASGSLFLFNTFKESLSSITTKPREAFIEILTKHSPPLIVSEIGELLKQWPDIYELAKKDSYARIISNILDRASNEKLAIDFAKLIFKDMADINSRLNSTKPSNWRILATLMRFSSAVSILESQLGTSIYPMLKAATLRYESATMPKAQATRKHVLEKLSLLQGNASNKRLRE